MLKVIPKQSFVHISRHLVRSYSMEQKLVVNGQTINYVRQGNGDHPVLCFPGALGTIWSDFKPQIEKLDKNKFTVIAWDPPGYGHSRPNDRQFKIDFYEKDAEMANEFMKVLNVGKYSVLGWSDGGIAGMIMAAKYKESIRKLVIWGANSYVLPEELKSYEKIRDISKWSDKMKKPLIELYTEPGLQKMWGDWCDALQAIYKQNNGDICKELIKEINCPTFILHGNKDPMVAEEHPAYLEKHIKGSKLHRFPDGKHNIHLRYADEFNDLVTKFLVN